MSKDRPEFETPEEAARALASRSAASGEESSVNVRLSLRNNSAGHLEMSWEPKAKEKRQWVGLFEDTSKPNNKYIGSYEWADKATKKDSGKGAVPGYEARYLVPDRSSPTSWRAVARTGPYPETVIHSSDDERNDVSLQIKIKGGHPAPNGLEQKAILSRSGKQRPNQVTFEAVDKDYGIRLSDGFWVDYPDGETFQLRRGQTSEHYVLDPNAPEGVGQPYTIVTRKHEHPPQIIIEP